MARDALGRCRVALLGLIGVLATASAGWAASSAKDALEPARAALRTLQYDKAVAFLSVAGKAGNPAADTLLGLMYLNGVGVAADAPRARGLLQTAAEKGQGEAAFVLAGELARDPKAAPGASRQWLERSASLGYPRAISALKANRPLLDSESLSSSDPALAAAWVIDRACKDDAAELQRLGATAVTVRDDFGRGALAYAVQSGALHAAATLIGLGAEVHAADHGGTTALMLAAERPEADAVELLLQHGANVRAADAEGRTALFYAARSNQVAPLRALLHGGAALNATDSHDYNALEAARAVKADASAAELRALGLQARLVPTGTERQTGKFDPQHPGDLYRNWPPLALAAARDDAASVEQLLAAGADPNLRLPQGDSVLQVAANEHALKSLAVLLAHGANPLAPDHAGHSALWLAASRNDVAILNALRGAGIKPDGHAPNEDVPLLAAVRAGHAEAVQILLDAGANPESADAAGHTSLMLAVAGGHQALLETLLTHHARTDATDRDQRTALWYAAAAGNVGALTSLLHADDEVIVDEQGLSPLHVAAARGETAAVAQLLAARARLNGRSKSGDTPLMLAAAAGHTEAVAVLLAHSPELDVQNSAGDTALIAASRGGYSAVCHALLAAGANRALRNSAHVSAADIAQGRGFGGLAKELTGKS